MSVNPQDKPLVMRVHLGILLLTVRLAKEVLTIVKLVLPGIYCLKIEYVVKSTYLYVHLPPFTISKLQKTYDTPLGGSIQDQTWKNPGPNSLAFLELRFASICILNTGDFGESPCVCNEQNRTTDHLIYFFTSLMRHCLLHVFSIQLGKCKFGVSTFRPLKKEPKTAGHSGGDEQPSFPRSEQTQWA